MFLEKPWKATNSHSDQSQNITKEPRTKNTTNISNGTMDHKGDTNATIYAGIVIGIIMVIVIALMMYLSRKKVSDQFSLEYQSKKITYLYLKTSYGQIDEFLCTLASSLASNSVIL